MTTPISLDTAMRLATEAFLPYGCKALAHEEDDSFSLTVTDLHGEKVLDIGHIRSTQYANPVRLAGVLEQARMDLAHQGRNLDPWAMPFIPDPDVLPETPPIY
ncbi:hypothetical protein PSm6_36320 [Pseudomonas solani]|uniref:DUF3509 domain-containing protein n=1 Tax=Pseudomonas solani TaxID=2731552 RepID=A0ABM7LC83_9PSED|nr:hypothetical protein [Pseudomonas solani]EQM71834.1 hypothetical protein L682_29340 [Pseudomonas alcaligenes OT 69]MDN4149297.1 hypothetical protein [Pseudomonas tohonis]BCD87225.1 hypothetical protein PSm6_36320 [Pseudomonas solani]